MKKIVDLVVENGKIITMNNQHEEFEGSLIINQDRIIDISNNWKPEYEAKKVVNAENSLVLPGFINTHTHAAMSIFRGFADDLTLEDWLLNYIFPAEAKFINPAAVEIGTKLSISEMIRSGTTTFTDMYFFEEEVAKAAEFCGMRAVVGEGILNFPTPNSKTPEAAFEYTLELIKKYSNHQLIKTSIAPHTLYTLDTRHLQRAAEIAEAHKIPLQIHLAENEWETENILKTTNLSPVKFAEKLNLLSNRTIAAHCVKLSKTDIEVLADKKVHVAHNPMCNMKLASGVAPFHELYMANVNVSVATDGAASNNNLDLLQEIRTAALLSKVSTNNPKAASARYMLDTITRNPAKALNMENEIGSLEVGKKADIVIIGTRKPHANPLYNPYSLLVYSLAGADVETVIINGKIVLHNQQFINFDENEIIAKANKLAKRIASNK